MAKRWTKKDKEKYWNELNQLYVVDNLSINEISGRLSIAASTVYKRLKMLDFPSLRHLKSGYNNSLKKILIPSTYDKKLAEFFGIMLGDGHINNTQVIVTLGTKDIDYVRHVVNLMKNIFEITPSIFTRPKSYRKNNKYRDVYFGSVVCVRWLLKEGLVHNKVKQQVDIPAWIFSNENFKKSFVRGFFDTDGSIYRLKFGIQISFTNNSLRLLKSLHVLLIELGYSPSRISVNRIYITRINDVKKFFKEIVPKNPKHQRRFIDFIKCVGTQVVNEDRL